MSNTRKTGDVLFSIFPNDNFVDLELFQYGREVCRPAHSFGPAVRNHYLFHYVFSGTGKLDADDAKGNTKSYQIKSGQGFMLFPGQISTYIADSKFPWDYAWIEFDGLRAKEIVETAGLNMDHPIYHAKSHDLRETMANEMVYITEHAKESPLHLIGHLYLFLDALSRSSASMKLSKGQQAARFLRA